MKFISINQADATDEQIVEFATTLGADFKPNEKPDKIRALVKTIHGDGKILVRDPDAPVEMVGSPPPGHPVPVSRATPIGGSFGRNDPRATINIEIGQEEGGERSVMVGVNGTIFSIKRGEDVEVPYRIYKALNDAQQTQITYTADPTTPEGVQESRRESRRFPVNLIRGPSADEVAAWEESIKDVELA